MASDPSNNQARTLLGLSYYGSQRFEDAVQYLEPAAKSDPSNMELHRLLAQSCLWAKNYSCAQDEFRELLQQSPDSAAAHVLMGEALDGLGRTAEAIAEFEAAAKISPKEPNVHFGLGYLYWKSHQDDEARKQFQLELAIDPGNAQSLAYLGDIEWKSNHPEEALALLKRVLTAQKNIRSLTLDLRGNSTCSRRIMRRPMTSFFTPWPSISELPDAHYQLGRLYQAQGKSGRGREGTSQGSGITQEGGGQPGGEDRFLSAAAESAGGSMKKPQKKCDRAADEPYQPKPGA